MLLTSVTVHITLVVPIGYDPLAFPVLLKLLTIDATPQLSAVEGAAMLTLAEQDPESGPTETLEGQIITGFTVS